jgi:hypothetical protein
MAHRLTRGELYDLVWSHPTQRVAKQFGISDVGLAEACRRAKIPVPGDRNRRIHRSRFRSHRALSQSMRNVSEMRSQRILHTARRQREHLR